MKIYELVYLISPELESEEAGALASDINAFLQKEGGTVIRAENPIPKTLSYRIKSQEAAFQVSVEFSLDPDKLKAIEDNIRKDQRIIRHSLISKNPAKEEVRRRVRKTTISAPADEKKDEKSEKKVELKDIEEKLEEILKE